MPVPSPRQPSPVPEPTPKRSRFDVEPGSIALAKRIKMEPTQSANPLSESDSDAMADVTPPKKKKSAFQKYGDEISQTQEEIARRDRRLQRFQEQEAQLLRTETPDYTRDAQIAASLVLLNEGEC